MADHAVLSPSAASRWIKCSPSARLEMKFPDTAGPVAAEGTLAHKLCELILKLKLKLIKKKEYQADLLLIMADKQYDNAMFDYCDEFTVYVLEQYAEARTHTKDALIFLESKIDLTKYVPEGFGTADVKIVADTWLTVIDYKYGKGVSVDAVENAQMKLYALGILEEMDFMYDIKHVRMIIYQPRLDNISVFEMTADDLKGWGETELKPRDRKSVV